MLAAELDTVSAELQQKTRKLANSRSTSGPIQTPQIPTPNLPAGMPKTPTAGGGPPGDKLLQGQLEELQAEKADLDTVSQHSRGSSPVPVPRRQRGCSAVDAGLPLRCQ